MTQILECPAKTVAREAQQIASGADLAVVKARQQIMWGSGDFAVIGTTLQSVGESLCEALDLESGSRVLDVVKGCARDQYPTSKALGESIRLPVSVLINPLHQVACHPPQIYNVPFRRLARI